METTTQAQDHHPDEAVVRKKGSLADLIIPLLAAAFAIYYGYTVWGLPWAAKANGIFLGGVLLLLVALFLVSTFRAWRRGEISTDLGELLHPLPLLGQRAWLIALMILFIAVIPYLGFTLTIFAFLVASMWVLGVRSAKSLLLVAGISALTGYLLFILVLDTPFPHGPVETLLKGLF